VVGEGVVATAEQGEVVEAGGSAVCPVLDVVGVAGDRWAGAAGERAVAVPQHQCVPDTAGDEAVGAADVENLAVTAEHGGQEFGITGETTDRGGGQRLTVSELPETAVTTLLSVSQPFAGRPSQLPKPGLHDPTWHVLATHAAVAFGTEQA
jgi:hypothetical protein